MKYIYIAAGILAALLILWIICMLIRRWRARCLVRTRTDEEKLKELNKAVMPFGFRYDICQDIFFSMQDAWQRKMGYGRIYDENAPGMNMVIDCEPLYFVYDGRSYMFELWKGQYGIATGAEAGLYVSDEVDTEHPQKLFYHSVADEEMLSMRFILRKKGRILMIRDEIHWWLTGFVLGEFSKPEELGMDVAVTFKNYRMRNAFYDSLLRAGYHKDNIFTSGMQVRFSFTRPHTKQPKHLKIRIRFIQFMNKRNCRRYLKITGCFVRTIDRLDYLGMCFPGLYRMLGAFSRVPQKCCRKKRPPFKRGGRKKETQE